MKIDSSFYRSPEMNIWKGRSDAEAPSRVYEIIKLVSLLEPLPETQRNTFALLGFACDEGVIRNQGRPGAAAGPSAFRKAAGNLPKHGEYQILDVGDVLCVNGDLETAQINLSRAVLTLLNHSYTPFLIGGGHEVAFAHWSGVNAYLKSRGNTSSLGVINFDTHLDLRQPAKGRGNSGTSFFQIRQQCIEQGTDFHYLPIGIQRAANTSILFRRAREWGVKSILAEEIGLENSFRVLTDFLENMDRIYLTICLDVFSAAVAPGVSAPSALGILPNKEFLQMLRAILSTGKVISCDLAELSPVHDMNQMTAQLAAALWWEVIESFTA